MAKVVESMPESRHAGRACMYDWKNWFDGRVWELTAGEDFTCKLNCFRSVVFKAASRAGVKVETRIREQKVFIQVVRREQA